MRKIFTYILALMALSVSCQRIELPEDPSGNSTDLPTGAIGSKAEITFSIANLMDVETKVVLDPTDDVYTLHLIVFDENGMLVEVCEATKLDTSDHDNHKDGRHYTVTLTVTDKPRKIHYVGNCPVDQIVYGHEASVIGNMYVDRNNFDVKTNYETSYWARIEVPFILVEEKEEVQTDGTKKIVTSLHSEIAHKFYHVPLLRNYAEITVTDKTNDKFKFIGYTVYNLLDRGTVAPYNSNTQKFQTFFDTIYSDGYKDPIFTNYTYPQLSAVNYEGHALTSAKLITDFIRNDDGTVKIYDQDKPFYVYERKVSVMTDEEEKWRESPPHIIIKGRYNNGQTVTDDSPIYYYKMDLVYTEKDAVGNEEIKYYNILRNFMYQFNITEVHDEGYSTLAEAVAGAAGNNISGSSSTSKLTNVSDNEGRLWVSYTDTTLVSNNVVSLKYKYIPNYYGTEKSEYTKDEIRNDLVRFENIVGDVITKIEVAENDITGDGQWGDYRNVTVYVKDPEAITHQQVLKLKTNSAHLNRQIRYTLREKLTMEVECTPKVSGSMMQPMTVDIKLPTGLTDDMFPLILNMETYDRTLSPDAIKNDPSIPVTAGPSIIDADGRRGEKSYYYTVTIPTFDAYRALPSEGTMKVYSTYWLTNKAVNASTMYVDNKYFNQGSDSWLNYNYTFSDVSCSQAGVGVDKDVTISFTMDNKDNSYKGREIAISLFGMTYNGQKSFTYTVPDNYNTSRDITISGLKTTTAIDPISFTIDADEYNIDGAQGARKVYEFGGAFVGVTSLKAEADIEVDFTFNISDEAFNTLNSLYPDAGADGVPMYVTLDRMHPADDQLVYSQARAEGDRYLYRIKQAGTQTIKLATSHDEGGSCKVTLQADYFATETKEIQQVGLEFRSLNITNNRIAQGTGRSVNITFQLAAAEGNNAQKDVTVTLTNMTINGEHTVTFNTGDNNAVTNNNGTYTIKNVVTADDPAGQLKVAITAKGYSRREATFNKERPKPKFTTNLDKTNLGADADQVVTLTFSSEDLVDGMPVTLELDGLRPQDDLPTKAVSYIYTVKGTGTQTIKLVTTESTTTSKTCSIQLKAECFEDSGIMNVVQKNVQTTTIDKKSIEGSLNGVSSGWNDNPNSAKDCTMTLSTANTNSITVKCDVTRNGQWNYNWTFKTKNIEKWTVTYGDTSQTINISLVYSNATYDGTCTVEQLMSGNVTGVQLTKR